MNDQFLSTIERNDNDEYYSLRLIQKTQYPANFQKPLHFFYSLICVSFVKVFVKQNVYLLSVSLLT